MEPAKPKGREVEAGLWALFMHAALGSTLQAEAAARIADFALEEFKRRYGEVLK